MQFYLLLGKKKSASLITVRMQGISTKMREREKTKNFFKIKTQTVLFQNVHHTRPNLSNWRIIYTPNSTAKRP